MRKTFTAPKQVHEATLASLTLTAVSSQVV